MAEIIYPNSIRIHGPWLIDHNELIKLDSIIQDGWNSLVKYKEQRIEEAIDARLDALTPEKKDAHKDLIRTQVTENYTFSKDVKTIKVIFNSGKHICSSSIKEAITERRIQDEIVKTIVITLQCGEINASIATGNYSDILEISVTPPTTSIASEFFVNLDRWANNVRPAKWLSWWREIAGFHWFILLVVLLMSTTALPDKNSAYKQHLKSEAYELLKNGVNENNSAKALEIILSLDTKYTPDEFATSSSNTVQLFSIFAYSLLAISIIMSFVPKTHIGITISSEKKIKHWRIWIKIISITIPSLIITGIVLPLIYDNIKILFQ